MDNDPQPERSPRLCRVLNEVSRYRQLLREERGPRCRVVVVVGGLRWKF